MSNQRFNATVLLAAWLYVGASAASADSISLLGAVRSAGVSIHSPGLDDVSAKAGELNWFFLYPSPAGLAQLFYSYSVDVDSWVQSTQTVTFQSTDGLNIAGVTGAGVEDGGLFNIYAPTIHDDGINSGDAALQAAILASLFNEMGSLTDGPFKLLSGGPAATQAFGYQAPTTLWPETPTRQGLDQTTMIPAPEPGTLLLMGSGLVLAWRRVRSGASASKHRRRTIPN